MQAHLIGSGTILREVEAAAVLLEEEWQVAATVWSATSFNELAREGAEVDRYNRLHPKKKNKVSYVAHCFSEAKGVIIAATDYMRFICRTIRPWLALPYTVLGTDGFGRSDTREKLRSFLSGSLSYCRGNADSTR